LNELILNDYPSSPKTSKDICQSLTLALKNLAVHHVDLESTAFIRHPPQIHAQAWVVSALSGLAMLCGGEWEAAMRAFRISNGFAWVVGDYECRQLIEGVMAAIPHTKHFSSVTTYTGPKIPDEVRRLVAFSPAMDNVNSKMNRFGVPPQDYIRAVLHRSVLFADGMVVPVNVIANSTVFVDEILFQGEIDQLNEVYIQHVFPILPSFLRNSLRKLRDYLDSRRSGFILEPVHKSHISLLDDYFNDAAHVRQIIYYDEDKISLDYGKYSRKQLEPSRRETTVQHLIRLWNHFEAGGNLALEHGDVDRSSAAHDVARDLTCSLFRLSNHLPESIYRSSLYRFADLFEEASDRQSFMKDLMNDTSEQQKIELVVARDRIIGTPWLYGPFCHELFDTPYRTNLAFDFALRPDRDAFVFLEEDEIPSWEFASAIRRSSESPMRLSTSTPLTGNHKYSSLLLSQVPEVTLLKTREELGPIRAKLSSGSRISEEDVDRMNSLMAIFQSRSLVLPEVDIKELVDLDLPLKEAAKRLLARCIFIVRQGLPLDPMYEEAQVTLPGLFALQHN
jgi:hypothetical protein